jgi:hypothetical protein
MQLLAILWLQYIQILLSSQIAFSSGIQKPPRQYLAYCLVEKPEEHLGCLYQIAKQDVDPVKISNMPVKPSSCNHVTTTANSAGHGANTGQSF